MNWVSRCGEAFGTLTVTEKRNFVKNLYNGTYVKVRNAVMLNKISEIFTAYIQKREEGIVFLLRWGKLAFIIKILILRRLGNGTEF